MNSGNVMLHQPKSPWDESSGDGSESAHSSRMSVKDSDMRESAVNQRQSREEVKIGGQESKAVFRQKLVVLLVLAASSIGVALSVYYYLTYSENKQFEQQFRDDSEKVLNAVGSNVDKSMASFDSVAVTLVSTAKMTNQTWPFVKIDDYAVRISKVLPLSGAIWIGAYHVITPKQREEWEAYTIKNDEWVDQSLAVQETWGGYYGPIDYNATQNSVVSGDYNEVPRNERYGYLCFVVQNHGIVGFQRLTHVLSRIVYFPSFI
jgi:hypothetical protein